MDLETIPGVGAKTAARLRELDDPESALQNGDVAAIAGAPGITDGQAARIVRAVIRAEHGDEGAFLASDRAEELYQDALELLKRRAVTPYARKRLETLYPSASETRIVEVRQFAGAAATREPNPAIEEALTGLGALEPARDVRVRERCLATGDAERYARAREAVPELSVELVDDARGIAELARGYPTVIVLDEAFLGVEVEGDVRVEPEALAEPAALVPERTLAFFARNRDRLRAAIRVARAAERTGPADTGDGAPTEPPLRSTALFEPACDLEHLETSLDRLETDGSVVGDDRLDALEAAVADLDVRISMAEELANTRLKEAIQERDVTIEGADLLSLVEQGAGVGSLFRRELADEFAAAVEAARSQLVEQLALPDHESLCREAFGDEPTFPVEADERVVSRLREGLTAERDRHAAALKQEVAETLASLREPAAELVEAALELDVELAIARFTRDLDCTMPSLGGQGVEVTGGRSPLLDLDIGEVDPVDYGVAGVALLSGVNSGGKTSTLDLLGLVVILTHMGLPVPAEHARVQRFESLHYQAKSQGTLDAGAFEATLREFSGLADAGSERCVLVDELESITEPGASAMIIAGILEALAESDATAVFVSHLAGEIRETAEIDVAVDGIEAVGLEDGELVVDRSPIKDHLARSTPELIVEKLAGETDGQSFYTRLLRKFGGAAEPIESD
jgi:dsDNA-specific endonuclease/ATPase MutS2